jgi:hypothetical protein
MQTWSYVCRIGGSKARNCRHAFVSDNKLVPNVKYVGADGSESKFRHFPGASYHDDIVLESDFL